MRFFPLWDRIRQSLWFIPATMTALAAIAAHITVTLDRNYLDLEFVRSFWFVFDVGGDGARATLSAIAQSVITVTGVVFSVTIVALQLAASQFTPRVLRTFLSDRGNQTVLGIFIATFTYTLLVERTVGTPFGNDQAFVPPISVTIAILMSMVSIGALIYFINHIAQSIRASVIISHVTADARKLIDELFPDEVGEPEHASSLDLTEIPPHTQLRAGRGGYLQALDEEALFSAAESGRMTIRMVPPMGRFLLPGEVLADVWYDEASNKEGASDALEKVRSAFVLGEHWTLGQDFERAIVEITDIAIRALSPGVNDPTTAMQCVDRLGELLTLLGNRHPPATVRSGEDGTVRFIARRLPWERAVRVAFEDIRHYGAGAPTVAVRVIEVCGRIRSGVPEDRHDVLEEQIHETLRSAREKISLPSDVHRVETAAEIALGWTGSGEP